MFNNSRAIALFDYNGAANDEISFKRGQNVVVTLQQGLETWWRGYVEGSQLEGLFPGSFVALEREMQEAKANSEYDLDDIANSAAGGADGGQMMLLSQNVAMKTSKFGVCASNLAIAAAFSMLLLGILSVFLWIIGDGVDIYYVACGGYCIIISIPIFIWEKTKGKTQEQHKIVPVKAIIYIGLSIFPFLGYFTQLAAPMLLASAMGVIASSYNQETWKPVSLKTDVQQKDRGSVMGWLAKKCREGDYGHFFFFLIYIALNAGIGFGAFIWKYNPNETIQINDGADVTNIRASTLSAYGALAFGFGAMTSLNCGFILIPVLRMIIRSLFNKATETQGGCGTKFSRFWLKFIPFDNIVAFHKLISGFVVITTIGHVGLHALNWATYLYLHEDESNNLHPLRVKYQNWDWIFSSGLIALTLLAVTIASAFKNLRIMQYELFWYAHHTSFLFYIFVFVHSEDGLNEHFAILIALPILLYIIEKVYRQIKMKKFVELKRVTFMPPTVISLTLEQPFGKNGYKEGQFVFLKCPYISGTQWHPFTLSSAPQDKDASIHIRVRGPGSWTLQLKQYLELMGNGKSSFNLQRVEDGRVVIGKTVGPDGKPILQIDGPHAAPTQHVADYNSVMLVSAGIGITPGMSSLRSIIKYRWRLGHTPVNLFFFWICKHVDVPVYKWFIHLIKDLEDRMCHLRSANQGMANQVEFHIFITSKTGDVNNPGPIGNPEYYGLPPSQGQHPAEFTAAQLYHSMLNPSGHEQFADVHVWNDRPNWDEHFGHVSSVVSAGDVGVIFCGPSELGKALSRQCSNHSSRSQKRHYKLHTEVF